MEAGDGLHWTMNCNKAKRRNSSSDENDGSSDDEDWNGPCERSAPIRTICVLCLRSQQRRPPPALGWQPALCLRHILQWAKCALPLPGDRYTPSLPLTAPACNSGELPGALPGALFPEAGIATDRLVAGGWRDDVAMSGDGGRWSASDSDCDIEGAEGPAMVLARRRTRSRRSAALVRLKLSSGGRPAAPALPFWWAPAGAGGAGAAVTAAAVQPAGGATNGTPPAASEQASPPPPQPSCTDRLPASEPVPATAAGAGSPADGGGDRAPAPLSPLKQGICEGAETPERPRSVADDVDLYSDIESADNDDDVTTSGDVVAAPSVGTVSSPPAVDVSSIASPSPPHPGPQQVSEVTGEAPSPVSMSPVASPQPPQQTAEVAGDAPSPVSMSPVASPQPPHPRSQRHAEVTGGTPSPVSMSPVSSPSPPGSPSTSQPGLATGSMSPVSSPGDANEMSPAYSVTPHELSPAHCVTPPPDANLDSNTSASPRRCQQEAAAGSPASSPSPSGAVPDSTVSPVSPPEGAAEDTTSPLSPPPGPAQESRTSPVSPSRADEFLVATTSSGAQPEDDVPGRLAEASAASPKAGSGVASPAEAGEAGAGTSVEAGAAPLSDVATDTVAAAAPVREEPHFTTISPAASPITSPEAPDELGAESALSPPPASGEEAVPTRLSAAAAVPVEGGEPEPAPLAALVTDASDVSSDEELVATDQREASPAPPAAPEPAEPWKPLPVESISSPESFGPDHEQVEKAEGSETPAPTEEPAVEAPQPSSPAPPLTDLGTEQISDNEEEGFDDGMEEGELPSEPAPPASPSLPPPSPPVVQAKPEIPPTPAEAFATSPVEGNDTPEGEFEEGEIPSEEPPEPVEEEAPAIESPPPPKSPPVAPEPASPVSTPPEGDYEEGEIVDDGGGSDEEVPVPDSQTRGPAEPSDQRPPSPRAPVAASAVPGGAEADEDAPDAAPDLQEFILGEKTITGVAGGDGDDVGWRKFSRSARSRNYRAGKTASELRSSVGAAPMLPEPRRRSPPEPRRSQKKREIARYDVRRVISERQLRAQQGQHRRSRSLTESPPRVRGRPRSWHRSLSAGGSRSPVRRRREPPPPRPQRHMKRASPRRSISRERLSPRRLRSRTPTRKRSASPKKKNREKRKKRRSASPTLKKARKKKDKVKKSGKEDTRRRRKRGKSPVSKAVIVDGDNLVVSVNFSKERRDGYGGMKSRVVRHETGSLSPLPGRFVRNRRPSPEWERPARGAYESRHPAGKRTPERDRDRERESARDREQTARTAGRERPASPPARDRERAPATARQRGRQAREAAAAPEPEPAQRETAGQTRSADTARPDAAERARPKPAGETTDMPRQRKDSRKENKDPKKGSVRARDDAGRRESPPGRAAKRDRSGSHHRSGSSSSRSSSSGSSSRSRSTSRPRKYARRSRSGSGSSSWSGSRSSSSSSSSASARAVPASAPAPAAAVTPAAAPRRRAQPAAVAAATAATAATAAAATAAASSSVTAVIDLDDMAESPPRTEPIVITDSEAEEGESRAAEPRTRAAVTQPVRREADTTATTAEVAPRSATARSQHPRGPKTPPEPAATEPSVKFTFSAKSAVVRPITNPLGEEEEEDDESEQPATSVGGSQAQPRGPSTPPEPPPPEPSQARAGDQYDPFEPTGSPGSGTPESPPSPDAGSPGLAIELSPAPEQSASELPPPLPVADRTSERPPEPRHPAEQETYPSAAAPVSLFAGLPPPAAPEPRAPLPDTSRPPPSAAKEGAWPTVAVADTSRPPPAIADTSRPPPTTAVTRQSPSTGMTRPPAGTNTSRPPPVTNTSRPPPSVNVTRGPAAASNARPSPATLSKPPPATGRAAGAQRPATGKSRASGKEGPSPATAQNGGVVDMDIGSPYSPDSPNSPDSREGDDLFEPPRPQRTASRRRRPEQPPRDRFDAVLGGGTQSAKSSARSAGKQSAPSSRHPAPKPAKRPGGKASGGAAASSSAADDAARAVDDVPNSAVEMQVKEKFLVKLNRQERVIEEVKLVLKPYFHKKTVTKAQYKEILRKSVPKICHSKSGEINPKKIQSLVISYVKKCKYINKKRGAAAGQTGGTPAKTKV